MSVYGKMGGKMCARLSEWNPGKNKFEKVIKSLPDNVMTDFFQYGVNYDLS